MPQVQEFPGQPRELASTTSIDVSIVDGAGDHITTFGGGTQYTEGDVDASITGTAAMWEDTGDVLRAVSAAKPLPVNIISGAGSGGTAITDDSAFTVGSTNVTPAGGVYKATRDSVDDGDVGAVAMTAKRGQYATIETPDGDSAMDETLNALKVEIIDGSGAQITTFGGGTQYTEGDSDSTITGTAAMMEVAANVLQPVQGTVADGLLVNLGANNDVSVTGSVAVTGTFYQATQPVSAASLPLPSGASTSANQTTIISHLDGVEGLLTTIDADTSVLSAIDYATGADVASLAVVGGGTEPTAQRVTIASDSSGVLSIDDNGGSITVDGTVAVSGSVAVTGPLTDTQLRATAVPISGTVSAAQSGTWTVQPGNTANTTAWKVDGSAVTQPVSGTVSAAQSGSWSVGVSAGSATIGSVNITDGTTKATVRELGTNDALNVAITDGSGNQITTFGGGTQYTEDDAAVANPVGTAQSLVRQDTPAGIATADGDIVTQRGTNYGAAYTQIVTSSGAFVDTFGAGTQYADGAARGSASGTLLMVDDGTNIQSASGDSSGRLNVNVNGTVTVDTELPTAASLADATGNPTTTSVGAEQMVFNGTTWDSARSAATTPTSTLTGITNTLPWAKYDATPTARTTGQSGPLQANIAGALNTNNYTLAAGEDQTNNVMITVKKFLASATYAPSRYILNTLAGYTANVKATTGNVLSLSITSTDAPATATWLQLHNTATTPAAAATAIYSFPVAAGTTTAVATTLIGTDYFTESGSNFSTGIAWALSTTRATYTAVAANSASYGIQINYI